MGDIIRTLMPESVEKQVGYIFQTGRKGGLVSRHQTGKVILLSRQHEGMVKNHEEWECRLTERENFYIAVPVSRVEVLATPYPTTDGFSLELRSGHVVLNRTKIPYDSVEFAIDWRGYAIVNINNEKYAFGDDYKEREILISNAPAYAKLREEFEEKEREERASRRAEEERKYNEAVAKVMTDLAAAASSSHPGPLDLIVKVNGLKYFPVSYQGKKVQIISEGRHVEGWECKDGSSYWHFVVELTSYSLLPEGFEGLANTLEGYDGWMFETEQDRFSRLENLRREKEAKEAAARLQKYRQEARARVAPATSRHIVDGWNTGAYPDEKKCLACGKEASVKTPLTAFRAPVPDSPGYEYRYGSICGDCLEE